MWDEQTFEEKKKMITQAWDDCRDSFIDVLNELKEKIKPKDEQ